MNSMSRIGAIAAVLALATLGVASAQVDQCNANPSELVIVEPLNVQRVQTTTPDFGAQILLAVRPVPCLLSTAGCYEFGVLPVVYSSPTSATVKQVGSSSNPILGQVLVEVLPAASTDPTTLQARLASRPTGTWRSPASAQVNVDPVFDGDLATQLPRGAKVQIPADFVVSDPAFAQLSSDSGVVALVNGIHVPPAPGAKACGFFQIVKRNFAGNQLAAKATEANPTPILFLRQAGDQRKDTIVVEPLNTQFVGTESPINIGAQTVMVATPVTRPASICGGPANDPTPIDCYEFGITYVTYDSQGEQVIHVPHPDPKKRVEAAITGTIEVSLQPISTQSVSQNILEVPTGSWDRTSSNRDIIIWTLQGAAVDANTFYETPTVRIPASKVQALIPSLAGAPGGVLAFIMGHHKESNLDSIGLFSPFKRNVALNQDVGNAHDALGVPVFFRVNPQSSQDREVILIEPLDLTTVVAAGAGMDIPVVECKTVNGADYYEFGITYVTYNFGAVEVHEVGGRNPIDGTLRVSVAGAAPGSTSAVRTWTGPTATAPLMADTTADQNLDVRFFKAAKVRIPRSAVNALPSAPNAPQFAVGTVLGEHANGLDVSSGFFNASKRNLAHTQPIANQLDQTPSTVLFRKDGPCAP
jgi:hypothetical protein